MEAKSFIELWKRHPKVKALGVALADSSLKYIHARGLTGSAAPLAFSALDSAVGGTFLFVLNDLEDAGYFYHDMVQMIGDENVLFFPSSYKRAMKYNQKDSANEILRTEVLSRLAGGDSRRLYVVTYPDAMVEKVASKSSLTENTLNLRVGEAYDVTELEKKLISLGFCRTDYVYEPGQFAIRGSILDVYSFSSECPYRIDFFGDDIDSIRTFEVQSQLSTGKAESVAIVPELHAESDGYEAFTGFLPENAVVVVRDLAFVCDKASRMYDEGFSAQALAEEKANLETQKHKGVKAVSSLAEDYDGSDRSAKAIRDKMMLDGESFARGLSAFRRVEIGATPSGAPDATVEFAVSPQPSFHKNFDLVSKDFHAFIEQGYKLYIFADSSKQTDRLKDIFDEMGRGEKAEADKKGENYVSITFVPVDKTVHSGFSDKDVKSCIFTDHQIFDRFHKYNLKSDKARSGKVALTLKELSQFEIGDYVVHIDHGVGRFGGLVRIPNNGTEQEMIKIIYQNDDVVYVSIHSLHKVSKYRGRDGEPPRLNKLGTGAWERMKDRVKTKVKDIARDLIKLYAQRREEKGFAFSPDSYMQHELEASFIYEDTPDQLKATQEVKADMEKDRPMDRLVCGDVGFGKTEVAIRAAFKAASDGKQVAVMVPTTVLAYQHYKTFSSRLKDFPVRVEYLSRARSSKDLKEVLKDLADGKIDIIIGTHKLIGKTVKFKDLGLLIIDEEQKFGVSVKEKLRQMKVNVDTLTMTATPIPRTLQFSLMGARDLSVIQTPPPNRYPVQTEIHTYSPEVIAEAINFEMSRNGQVFFVNNKISNLPEIENMIHRTVPDARVCVGHGRMDPKELEDIVYGFMNYDYDVMLSTTIVENGIDVPNANTIIINGAQNYGLSDLHQMRGRVGRGNKKAFCYLLAPPLASLSDDSRRRLQAIENFSDLGSGIHIAMQDLDIRGAGNMLGAEQSGFIADLGYETYQKVLTEAVNELKETEFAGLYEEKDVPDGGKIGGTTFVEECTLECDLDIFFPEEFVPSSTERMSLYRELDSLNDERQLADYRQRLIDRFGKIPSQAEELIRVMPLKWIGRRLGAEKIVIKQGRMIMYLVADKESRYYKSEAFDKVITYASWHPRDCQLRDGDKRSLLINHVSSIEHALYVLNMMESGKK